jgi:peptidoglycan hydrolase-like protein with peptidoglycan-binding domain
MAPTFYAATADDMGLTFPRTMTPIGDDPRTEVHHSVYPAPIDHAAAITQVHRIEDQHLAKSWNGVFYNDFADPTSGWLYQGRSGRSTSQGPPARTLCILADLRTDVISAACQETIYNYARVFGGTPHIIGHRERPYATLCPGPDGQRAVREIRGGWLPGFATPDVDTILRYGDSNFVVAGLQYILAHDFGYDLEAEPGYGDRTAAAVEEFQLFAGLEVDGTRWTAADQEAVAALQAFLHQLPAAAETRDGLEVSRSVEPAVTLRENPPLATTVAELLDNVLANQPPKIGDTITVSGLDLEAVTGSTVTLGPDDNITYTDTTPPKDTATMNLPTIPKPGAPEIHGALLALVVAALGYVATQAGLSDEQAAGVIGYAATAASGLISAAAGWTLRQLKTWTAHVAAA